MNRLPSMLLAVTDRHQATAPLPEVVERLLGAGLRWLWLRDRDLPPAGRRILAETLAGLVRKADASLSVGGDVDIAEALGAGVHLNRVADVSRARARLGAKTLVGLSAHTLPDIRAAREAGADYATLSPVFASPSKPGYGPALGLAALTEAARIGLPILALGGVTPATAVSCLEAGASGLAVMGALMRGDTEGLSDFLAVTRRS